MDIVFETEKILGNEIGFEVWNYSPDTILVEIIWGDWKHEHRRADWLMEQNGFKLVRQWVTESDGSDCYSAVHEYRKENF